MRLVLLSVFSLLGVPAGAHDGPLDSYGCHPNIAHGTYHCHRGPLAERQYRSWADMVRAQQERERRERPKPQRAPRRF